MKSNLLLTGLSLFILLCSCSAEGEKEIQVTVKELICDDGVHLIEARLLELPGLRAFAANPASGELRLRYRETQLDSSALTGILSDLGFTVNGQAGDENAHRRLPACCLAADTLDGDPS